MATTAAGGSTPSPAGWAARRARRRDVPGEAPFRRVSRRRRCWNPLLPVLLVVLLPAGACVPVEATGDADAEGTARIEAALTPTTVIVVRHAERAPGEDDPHLSAEGAARAATLAWMLQGAGVTTIYSTPYNRTRQTVGPLAELLGIDVRLENVGPGRDGSDEPFRAFARRVLEAHPGEVVLIAGHSNTVGEIVTAFGAGEVPQLTTEEYDHLFILDLPPSGEGRLLRLRFGEPNPALSP